VEHRPPTNCFHFALSCAAASSEKNPCDVGFLHLLLDSSSPGVLWSASIPLSLRVPLESSSCDVVSWFPQRVFYLCPSHSFEQDFSRFLVRCFPQPTLLILSYHLIPRVLLSDLFITTWIFLVSVFVDLQVSEPYNNNCFTFELNSLSFVLCTHSMFRLCPSF